MKKIDGSFKRTSKVVIVSIVYLLPLLLISEVTADIVKSNPWTFDGKQADSYLGSSVASAGDVNGDGYTDLVVGAYGFDNAETSAGKVYVFYGSASGPGTTADWSKEGTYRNHVFGKSVASAGDINNDGYDDIIVGAWNFDQVFVYHGSASGLSGTPDWSADFGGAQRGKFGWSVSSAGDVNNDGYNDIIVGMPGYTNGQSGEGRAMVFHGSASGLSAAPNWTYEVNQQDAQLGYSVSAAGDVNGDGYGDVIVGAHNQGVFDVPGGSQAGEGHAHVFYGSATGLNTTPNWTAESNITGAYFGYSVSTAGDVNGDGYDDVIIGANGYNSQGLYNVGRAYLYHGSSSGLSTSPNWTAKGTKQYSYFGTSVSTAGDLDGDGYSDVIVGADGKGFGSAKDVAGDVFVYKGSASGLSALHAWTASTGQANDQFGHSVSELGDLDNDGADDIVVGAREYNGSYTSGGRTYLYYGSCTEIVFYKDSDGDGYGDPLQSFMSCQPPAGWVPDNTDCDDEDALENPDQTWYRDADGDGYSDGTTNTESCTRPAGYKVTSELIATSGDCADDNSAMNPSASEVCNGSDDNCNSQTDEGVLNTYYADGDGDGYGDSGDASQACAAPAGYVSNAADCDDGDNFEYPGQTWYKDADGDGYSDGTTNMDACVRPVGYYVSSELNAIAGDCADDNSAMNPSISEVCNDADDNCNGQIDEGVQTTYYADGDGDGYGDSGDASQTCAAPTGYVSNAADCDDGDNFEHPNQTWYKDADGDGYSDGITNMDACARPVGYYVSSELNAISGDCADDDDAIHPGNGCGRLMPGLPLLLLND